MDLILQLNLEKGEVCFGAKLTFEVGCLMESVRALGICFSCQGFFAAASTISRKIWMKIGMKPYPKMDCYCTWLQLPIWKLPSEKNWPRPCFLINLILFSFQQSMEKQAVSYTWRKVKRQKKSRPHSRRKR